MWLNFYRPQLIDPKVDLRVINGLSKLKSDLGPKSETKESGGAGLTSRPEPHAGRRRRRRRGGILTGEEGFFGT